MNPATTPATPPARLAPDPAAVTRPAARRSRLPADRHPWLALPAATPDPWMAPAPDLFLFPSGSGGFLPMDFPGKHLPCRLNRRT